MKRILMTVMAVYSLMASSCTVFVFNEDDRHRKDSPDSTSITIITSAKPEAGIGIVP